MFLCPKLPIFSFASNHWINMCFHELNIFTDLGNYLSGIWTFVDTLYIFKVLCAYYLYLVSTANIKKVALSCWSDSSIRYHLTFTEILLYCTLQIFSLWNTLLYNCWWYQLQEYVYRRNRRYVTHRKLH